MHGLERKLLGKWSVSTPQVAFVAVLAGSEEGGRV